MAQKKSDTSTSSPILKIGLARLRDLMDEFLTEYLSEKSKETVGTYRRSLNEFERWFATQKGRFLFRVADVENYKTYLTKTRGLSQVSVSTYLTAVRRFCQYLVDIGMLAENPALQVKGNRRPAGHSRAVLTETEVEILLDVVDVNSILGQRDMAIIYLMLFAGLSEIELVRADIEDLKSTTMGWQLHVQAKGHTAKDQQASVDARVMEKIRIYLDQRESINPEAPLFVSHGRRAKGNRLNTRSIRGRIKGWLTKAKINRKGISTHSLTHTAALIWLNEGLTLEQVRHRMRHGTLDTTMIYFKQQGLLKKDPDEIVKDGL